MRKSFVNIFSIVSKIPRGKVMTYKQVTKMSNVKNPRLVGFALHRNTDPNNIPCHRVVRTNGRLATGYAFGGIKRQKEKLENEGIVFLKNRINLKQFMFD